MSKDIDLDTWKLASVLSGGFYEFMDYNGNDPDIDKLQDLITEIAKDYGISAWELWS